MSRYRRVGHKGADHIAPGNTAASFDAALAAGVDMIEFDVLPEDWRDPARSRLLLAHDYTHDLSRAATLEEGLDHLAAEAFTGVELDVDLKLPGYEARVVEALRERDLIDRTLVSSMYRGSLRKIRAMEPALRLGWSIPKATRDYAKAPWRVKLPAYARITMQRPGLPRRIRAAVCSGEVDAIMCHWRLITRGVIRAVTSCGGELYVWTVDDPARIERLERLGVTGIISNDPRLLGARTR